MYKRLWHGHLARAPLARPEPALSLAKGWACHEERVFTQFMNTSSPSVMENLSQPNPDLKLPERYLTSLAMGLASAVDPAHTVVDADGEGSRAAVFPDSMNNLFDSPNNNVALGRPAHSADAIQVTLNQLDRSVCAGVEGVFAKKMGFSDAQKVKIVRFWLLPRLAHTPKTENPKNHFLPAGNWVRKSSLFSCLQEISIRFCLTLG